MIGIAYREFNDLTGNGPYSQKERIEKLKILMSQVEKASKEGLSCLMGDLNLDLKRFEEMKYYAKKESDEFQLLAAEIGLEILNFGYTWRRVIEGVLQQSSLDSALINKIRSVKNYNTVDMNCNSDHSAILLY